MSTCAHCVTPLPNLGHCHLCHGNIPSTGLLAHIRNDHPSAWGDGPQTWPDGEIVVDASDVAEVDDFRV